MRWVLLALCTRILLWCAVRAKDCPYPCVCFVNADEDRTLTVDCRNQELSEIPLGIPATTSHLDVSYNSIQFVRAVDLQNLPILTYLQLHTNDIMDIESGAFQDLPSLEVLTLQNNLLRMLRLGTFTGLSKLQTLNLRDNYIEELDPEIFSPLQNLIILNLSFNSLEFIMTGTFFNLTRLFNLDLSDNFIGTVQRGAIGNLPYLRTLNLEGNQLQSISTDAWVDVPFLHSLSVGRNPLECGCSAMWLRQWFLERSLRGPVVCSSPPDLRGMDLLELTPADFCRLPTATIVEVDPAVLSEGMTLQLTCVTSGAPPPVTTWSRKGMSFDLMSMRLEIVGNSLVVNDVIANDSGRYFCSASSSAGTAVGSIDVAVVKKVNMTIPVTIATTGDTVVLECDNNLPLTVATRWMFNSSKLDLTSNTTLNFTGRFMMGERGELIVFNIQEEDMGRYECILTDEVSLFRDLEIQAPPQITIRPEGPCETPDVLFVTTVDSVRLVCDSSGVPTPTVTWTTPRGDTISGLGAATVPLVPPTLGDTGEYVCRAVNEIGEDISSIAVNVMDVLSINQTSFDTIPLMVGETAILNCSVANMITVEFEWQRESRRPLPVNSVQTSDGTLILPDVQLEDVGLYRCQAMLGVGQIAFIERGVLVFELPQVIRSCPRPEVVAGIENGEVTLNCSVRGIPRPMLEWMFGNETIPDEEDDRFTFSSRRTKLTISDLQLNDSGVYTCNAMSDVGVDMYSFLLEVQDASFRPFFRQQPPSYTNGVNGVNGVIAGNTARLPCEGGGTPTPTLSWFKTPLELDISVTQILPSERVVISPEELVIFDVRPSDEGFYFCTVENELGQKTSTLSQFNVWIPPQLQEGLPIEYLVVEGTSSIVIPCSGTGDPKPDLHWLRGSFVLPLSAKQRILPNGSLEIILLSPEDAGMYMCRLANVAGEQYRTVNIIVRAIPRTQIDPRNPSPVDLGSQLSLFCSDMGTRPEALESLEWRRDEELLVTGGHVVVFPDTGELVLSNLQISDSGNYSCEISSYAGSSVAFVLLSVEDPFLASGAMLTPLSISPPTSPFQTLAEGQTAQFPCIASQPPPPVTIAWFKDGSPLRNLKRITIDEDTCGLLTIIDTRYTDTGNYSCVASNRIGEEDSITFSLTISTPPMFTWFPEALVVEEGLPFELRCKAFGRPDPQITWLHNGTQLSDQDCIIINPTTNTLTVCNTTASSAGWYSCFVRNPAGTAEFSVPVTIIPEPPIAPNITTSSRTLIIESGEPLILDCIAVGIPRPTVTWFKDEVLLNSTCPDVFPGDCLLVDDVSVYIQDTRESDSGTYTCVAANSAGISVFAVHVLVQPLSSTSLPIFTVFPTILNQSDFLVEVECRADGQPLPELSWLTADNRNISTNSSERIHNNNGILRIFDPVPEDSGQYICLAENTAGINQASIALCIGEKDGSLGSASDPGNDTGSGLTSDATRLLEPDEQPQEPKFLVAPYDVSTYRGLPVVVPCSTAKTADSFTVWRKEGRPLYQDDAVTIETNGTLIIQRSKVDHSGEYSCVAVSEKGFAMATIYIQVLVRPGPPEFLTTPTNFRVMSGSDFLLPCQPDWSSNETTSLTWLFNGQTLLERCGERDVLGNGSLHVTQATPTSSGVYTCRLSNQYATVDAMATVIVSDYPISNTVTVSEGAMLFQLLCGVEMLDEVQVLWTMGRQPLNPSSSLIPFGARLLFLTVDASQEGEYTCTHNEEIVSLFLEVLVPPAIVNTTSSVQATADTAVILRCPATASPRPQITWYLEGEQLERGTAVSPLPDGSLYIHPPLPVGEYIYTCVASNQAGDDRANTTITVTQNSQ